MVLLICKVAGLNARNTFADLSLCFNIGPADFHSVRLCSNSAGSNVQYGVQSFQNVCARQNVLHLSWNFGLLCHHLVHNVIGSEEMQPEQTLCNNCTDMNVTL